MFYLIPYSAMSLGAFAVVAARERELGAPVTLQNLAGFGWERPFLGVSMWVFMLGMLGFPLTGGFIAKFYVFAAAYDRGFWWLIVAGVIATMISAYYYLGIVRAMYFRDAAELQLAPAGGSPPRELLLGLGVAICVVVTVGSFFAVAAADRRRPLGRATRCRSRRSPRASRAAAPGAARTARRASTTLSPNTTRQATSADAPSVGSVCVWAAGERAAHESTRNASARPQSSDWKPASEPGRSSRYSPKQTSADDRCERDRRQQRVEGQPVCATGVGHRRDDREESRKRSTSHEHLASPSGRTVLLCSSRPEPGEKERIDGNVDMAGARVVPARHRRRQAHLRRSVAQRSDLPRLRARPRARRRDRGHARARRSRRRRGRAPAEARLQGGRDGRADGVALGERRRGRRGRRVQQGRDGRARRRPVHADERLPFELGARRHVHGRAGGVRHPRRRARRSTSPATRASSATCS